MRKETWRDFFEGIGDWYRVKSTGAKVFIVIFLVLASILLIGGFIGSLVTGQLSWSLNGYGIAGSFGKILGFIVIGVIVLITLLIGFLSLINGKK